MSLETTVDPQALLETSSIVENAPYVLQSNDVYHIVMKCKSSQSKNCPAMPTRDVPAELYKK